MAADDWPPGQGPGIDFGFTSGEFLRQTYTMLSPVSWEFYAGGANYWPRTAASPGGAEKRWASLRSISSWINFPPIPGVFIGPGHYMIEAYVFARATLEAQAERTLQFGGGLQIFDGSGELPSADFAAHGQSHAIYLPGPGHALEYDAHFQVTRWFSKYVDHADEGGPVTQLALGAQIDPALDDAAGALSLNQRVVHLVSAQLTLTRFPDALVPPSGQVAAAGAPGAVVRRR